MRPIVLAAVIVVTAACGSTSTPPGSPQRHVADEFATLVSSAPDATSAGGPLAPEFATRFRERADVGNAQQRICRRFDEQQFRARGQRLLDRV